MIRMLLPMLRLPALWWVAFGCWLVLLYFLSGQSPPDVEGPEIPQLDKLLHLVYFAAGGGVLAMALALASEERVSFKRIATITILVLAAVGALDEWHQTFTEGRSGADIFDWVADFLGGILGAALAVRALPLVRSLSEEPASLVSDG